MSKESSAESANDQLMPENTAWTAELLIALYRTMLQIRLTEERIASLIEGGEIKTPCHLCIGQEAVAAGVCAALKQEDSIWGGHRSHGHYLAKGGDPNALMAEIFGKTTGCSKGRGGSMHLVAPEIGLYGTVPLVAATIPLAVGAALASTLRGDSHVAVAFFGDGATEEGHFHESMNLAALYRLPVLFVCENNFYSTHMALRDRRPQDNIAQTADLYGFPGKRIDGNDAVVVHEATLEAVVRAREGRGPTLLECRTYRWRGHVGPAWDLDVGEQRRRELEEWVPKDPIPRLRRRIVEAGGRVDELERIEQEVRADIEAAVYFARESPFPDSGELLQQVCVPRS
jgi:TPP-dependent pyruvate/acetoin dehydrogenase alpha subunit